MTLTVDGGRPLRVCVVAPALPPAIGGAEVVAETIIEILLRLGVETEVFSGTADATVRTTVTAAGSQFNTVGREVPPDAIAWEYDTFARAKAIWERCRRRPPDLIHVFSHDAAVAVAIAAPRVPVVATFSEMATESSDFGADRSRFVYSLPVLSLITASSDFYTQVSVQHGFPPERIRRLVTGVDVERFAAGSAERGRKLLGIGRGAGSIVLCPSRFTPRKGQLDLVAAVASLSEPRPTVVLVGSAHSGSMSYRRHIYGAIIEQGLRGIVQVVESVVHRDMPHVYAASDLVVQPSYAEGLGLAALEAMAAGVPLLATKVSGFDQFLNHGRNAVLVPPGDAAALANGIRQLLADAGLRSRVVTQAAADVREQFGLGRTARELVSVYNEAVSASVHWPGGLS